MTLSTSSGDAAQLYDESVECSIRMRGDPFEPLKKAVEYDAGFGMAYIMQAYFQVNH